MQIDSYFIKFNISESEDKILIKVGADGEAWKAITMSLDELNSPDYLDIMEKKTKSADPAPDSVSEYQCPNCGTIKKTFLRSYTPFWFCGFCGAHLRVDTINKTAETIAKID